MIFINNTLFLSVCWTHSSDTHTELSHHANEKPDPAFGKSDKIKYTGRGVDMMPITLTPEEAKTDLELGSTVEVVGNPENFRYGVVRWIGYFDHKGKPLVGLEMVGQSFS